MKQVYLLFISALIVTTTFAQDKKESSSNGDDIVQQMFDYSRPGKYHQLLADLAGSWTFKGRRFPLKNEASSIFLKSSLLAKLLFTFVHIVSSCIGWLEVLSGYPIKL